MRLSLLLIVVMASACRSTAVHHANYDARHDKFTCPAHTDMWASESEALNGKEDFVYCIPVKSKGVI